MTISEQIMYATLRITMLDGNNQIIGTGTGFMFAFCESSTGMVPALVSNRHVLCKCQSIRISFTRMSSDGAPMHRTIDSVHISTSTTIPHPDPKIDLAILPMAQVIHLLSKEGRTPFYKTLSCNLIPSDQTWNNLDAIEDVTMVGYPHGLYDTVNNLPVFRQGITASHPKFNFDGEPKFLVDMACYPGSSGSPVFIHNRLGFSDPKSNSISLGQRLLFLGVQHAAPISHEVGNLVSFDTTQQVVKPVTRSFYNIGYIVKSTELLVFESILMGLANQN